jgi:hypothetical protein
LQGGLPRRTCSTSPNAPDGIRSEFKPIATSALRHQCLEHLPRMGRWMHRAVIVRSVYHNGGCHNNLPMYTGHDVPPPDDSPPTRTAEHGLGLSYHEQEVRGEKPGELPHYVYLPCPLGWGERARRGRVAASWASATIRCIPNALPTPTAR